MDLALFKARYPQFVDDVAITVALSDAEVLLQSYQIKPSQYSLAMAYMTAHLLTADKTDTDTTEPQVKRTKADTVEFADLRDKSLPDIIRRARRVGGFACCNCPTRIEGP